MNESEPNLAIRRILIALDASTHSLAALHAAAEMAANMQAELIGLFVEDENLLHLAGLPFAQEVRSSSAESEVASLTTTSCVAARVIWTGVSVPFGFSR